ncbi:MAG: amidohydrolase family protein, partial [Opitutaceae bacterium]
MIVTMDTGHRIFSDGALAVRGDRIVDVGLSRDMEGRFEAAELIDGRRFVITPGFIDAHVHITGDPLTRGYVADDIETTPQDRFDKWVMPRFLAHTADDERVSAQLAALQMLRSGTTCFLEAGTVLHLDAVVDGLRQSGIRARVGAWVEGRVHDRAEDQTRSTDAAIALLEDEVARFPADQGAKIAAWPILVGHATNTDEVWKAAKRLADQKRLGISAHMSPFKSDPDWYLENVGRRPLEHLAHIGVLGDNLSLTHLVHLSVHEVELLAESGTNAIHCPLAALRGAFGISAAGRFPEMHAAGVNIGIGSDGDMPDLMHKMSLASAIFKDARQQAWIFPADETLAMA